MKDSTGEFPDEEIDSSRMCVCGNSRIPKGWCIVNVGGKRFETSLATLCSHPDSMLALMVRYHPEEQVLNIDRDGKRFSHVLNYLRNGTLLLEDRVAVQEVSEEADFYQLQGLKKLCEEILEEQQERRQSQERENVALLKEALQSTMFCLPKPVTRSVPTIASRFDGSHPLPIFDLNADF